MRKLTILFISLSLLLSGCELIKGTPLEGLGSKISATVSGAITGKPEKPVEDFLNAVVAKDYKKASDQFSNQKIYSPEYLKTYFENDKYNKFTVSKPIEQDKKTIVKFSLNGPISNGFLQAVLKKDNGTWQIEGIEEDPEIQSD